MRLYFAIMVGVLITPCFAEPLATDASKQEMDQANYNFIDCLIKMSKTYDDGKSDAQTIAVAIESMCEVQFQNSIEVNSRGMSDPVKILFAKKVRQDELGIATSIVLSSRKPS